MIKEKELFDYLDAHFLEMVETLILWSEQNSGSHNAKGLSKMASLIQRKFEPLATEVKELQCKPFQDILLSGEKKTTYFSNSLLFRGPKAKDRAIKVLLVGHMDTVFPVDSTFQKVKRLDENTLNGPGVADMKGGLLVIFYALKALNQSSFKDDIQWSVFINSDEELGSMGSSDHLKALAREHDLALVYEPSMDLEGSFAGKRKGSGKFTFLVEGVSAHAGREFNKGRNAICLLSELLCEVHKLNGQREGVTLNVGLIKGGSALNAVAATAVSKVDVRLNTKEDKAWVLEQFEKIVTHFNDREGFKVTLAGDFFRAPKPMNTKSKALFSMVESVCKKLDLPFSIRESGGCCDGNNLQEAGLAVVDTLGVVGANIHSDQEIITLDSLVKRSKLTLSLLAHLVEETKKEYV